MTTNNNVLSMTEHLQKLAADLIEQVAANNKKLADSYLQLIKKLQAVDDESPAVIYIAVEDDSQQHQTAVLDAHPALVESLLQALNIMLADIS